MGTVDSVMAINYSSPVRLTLALLPQMLERDSGLIVNIASVAATLSSPGESAYDASKAALAVFSEAMAIDLWETGVEVMVVYPGLFDTELFSLPDNDPAVVGIEAEPVSVLVDGGTRGDAVGRSAGLRAVVVRGHREGQVREPRGVHVRGCGICEGTARESLRNLGVHAAALYVEIHLGESRSLKQKRSVVRHLLDTARQRYRVSASEVAHQDLWQLAGLGFAARI